MVTTLYALYMTTGCYYEMSSDSIPGAGVSVTGLVVACQLEAAQLIAWRTLEPSDWVVIEETLVGARLTIITITLSSFVLQERSMRRALGKPRFSLNPGLVNTVLRDKKVEYTNKLKVQTFFLSQH